MNEGNLHQQTADVLAGHSTVAVLFFPIFFLNVFSFP